MTKLILVRIGGRVGVKRNIERTLDSLRLKIKHATAIVDATPETLGMIKKVEHFIAYGEIDEETARLLAEKRGRVVGDKPLNSIKIEEFMKNFINGNKSMEEIGIKPFFRLQPPKGGFKKSTKLSFPRGVLGNHGKNINDLVKRML